MALDWLSQALDAPRLEAEKLRAALKAKVIDPGMGANLSASTASNVSPEADQGPEAFVERLNVLLKWLTSKDNYKWPNGPWDEWYLKLKELNKLIKKNSQASSDGSEILQIVNGARLPLLLPPWEITDVWNTPRISYQHQGIDQSGGGIKGKPVRAIEKGRVFYANTDQTSWNYGWGTQVLIYHYDKGFSTLYAHLHELGPDITINLSGTSKGGQEISKGQIIGTVGGTGSLAKTKDGKDVVHLHFVIFEGESWNSGTRDPLTHNWNS